MLNSVNCSTVICSPTVEYLCSWEKPLVKPMAPGSILIISISITLILFCFFTLHLYTKNIISIISHSRKWSWRDWQPLIVLVASSYRFVQVRGTWAWPPTGLIPWFSKTEGNTYATLLHHPFLFKGKPTQCSRGSTCTQQFLLGILWRCTSPICVRAYQAEAFSHKHHNPKL